MKFSPRKTKSKTYCSVYDCNSKACKNDTVKILYFPKEHQSVVKIVNKFNNEEELSDRHAAWIKILKIGKKVTPSMKVCSYHHKVK